MSSDEPDPIDDDNGAASGSANGGSGGPEEDDLDDAENSVDDTGLEDRLRDALLEAQARLNGDGLAESGLRIGNYTTIRRIGSGAFGIVHLARHIETGRHAALKVPRMEVLTNDDLLSRFASEAAALTHLNHPGIVRVFQAEADGPTPFIAAAYCPGPSLREWIHANSDASRRDWEAVCRLIAAVADAVDYAHRNRVYHRDLKPENILLFPIDADSDPVAPIPDEELLERPLDSYRSQLTDFGLAKLAGQALTDTRSSLLLGTAAYMSAEQLEGREAAGPPAACDVYSLGVILFELLAGRLPHEGRNYIDMIDRVRSGTDLSLRPSRPEIPKSVETVIRNSLHINPYARYRSASQLAEDLRRCISGGRVRTRHASPLKSLKFWAGHPKRIMDAGRFTLWSNLIIGAWAFTGVSGVYYFSKAAPDDFSIFRDCFIVTCTLHFPAALIGLKTTRGRPWAIRLGLVFSLMNLFIPIVAIVKGPTLFKVVYEGDPFLTFMVHLMLLICFIVQLGLYAAAFYAYEILRRSSRTKES